MAKEYRTLKLTTPLIKGDHVKQFQEALTHAGYYTGSINSQYGPLTAQAVYRAKYNLGYLNPDQVAGDKLYAFLTGQKKPNALMKLTAKERAKKAKKKTLGQLAFAEAKKHVGTKENPAGSNLNPFGKWYGMNAQPWCAIFVTYCYVVGAKSKSFKKGKDYSYVPTMDADARAGRNHLTVTHDPKQGDVVTYDWDKDGEADHTGIFDRWIDKAAGTFAAIEGNTGIGNDSNGGEVMDRVDRNKSEVRTFIRVGA